jgi:hypothetical protein
MAASQPGRSFRAADDQIVNRAQVVKLRSFQDGGDAHLDPIDLQEQAKSRSDADE